MLLIGNPKGLFFDHRVEHSSLTSEESQTYQIRVGRGKHHVSWIPSDSRARFPVSFQPCNEFPTFDRPDIHIAVLGPRVDKLSTRSKIGVETQPGPVHVPLKPMFNVPFKGIDNVENFSLCGNKNVFSVIGDFDG